MNKPALFALAASAALLLALVAPATAAGARALKTEDTKPGKGPKTDVFQCAPDQRYSSKYPDNKMTSVSSLYPGCYLESPNKKCQLVYQCDDGNLVLYRTDTWEALWASGPQVAKDQVGRAELQVDGNLVVKDVNAVEYWASHTGDKGIAPYTIEVTNKCEVFVYDSSKGAQNLKYPIWTPDASTYIPNWGNN